MLSNINLLNFIVVNKLTYNLGLLIAKVFWILIKVYRLLFNELDLKLGFGYLLLEILLFY